VFLVAAQLLHQLLAVQSLTGRLPCNGLDHLLPYLLLEVRLRSFRGIASGLVRR